MRDLNRAQIMGNLTRDPDIRQTPQGISVATLSVATTIGWTDYQGQRQERTEYHTAVLWRRLADLASHLHKGSKVYLEGRLQTRTWDDAQSGQKRYKTEIIVENFVNLDPSARFNEVSSNESKPTAGQEEVLPAEEPVIDIDDASKAPF